MSVHFDPNKISFFSLDEWSVAVCAWRGCCIEVFSRAEHSVADCILTLQGAGVAIHNDAQHQGAVARLRALHDCMEKFSFNGHEKVARRRIANWQRLVHQRNFLAHARIDATQSGIVAHHYRFDGKQRGEPLPPKQLTRIEMLQLLAELEDAQRALHGQLGCIKAFAPVAKPILSAQVSS
ncbi:MAG: hypothetical protein RLZZ475_720 [Pseudomonadota bacterium]|jgi:hypothetical protein